MDLIPPDKKHLFWSVNSDDLDKEKHKKYIIHQVLQFGDLDDYRWLKTIYSEDEIKTVFVDQPRKTYLAKSFHFVKDYLLQINTTINPDDYVTTSF